MRVYDRIHEEAKAIPDDEWDAAEKSLFAGYQKAFGTTDVNPFGGYTLAILQEVKRLRALAQSLPSV